MTAKCPKCNAVNPIPACPNCSNPALRSEKVLSNFYLTCRRCEKSYSYVPCSRCDCQIPARAFAGFSAISIPALTLLIVAVILIFSWLVR